MQRAMTCAAFAVAASLPALPGNACAADKYSVSIDLVHDGKVFAKSRLLLPPGSETTVGIPEDGLSMVLVATDAGDGRIRLVTRVTSAFGIMQPTLLLMDGQAASIANDEIEMNVTAAKVAR